jgi:hypothetical protein
MRDFPDAVLLFSFYLQTSKVVDTFVIIREECLLTLCKTLEIALETSYILFYVISCTEGTIGCFGTRTRLTRLKTFLTFMIVFIRGILN